MPSPRKRSSSLRRWLQEPLLHFLAVALLFFAIDHIVEPPAEAAQVIVIDDAVVGLLREQLSLAWGRAPSEAELEQQITQWISDEVLYREARSLGLDQGDEMLRARLIAKMRSLIYNSIVAPDPAPAEREADGREAETYRRVLARMDEIRARYQVRRED